MNVSREELQTLCDELDRVYNIMREDYDNTPRLTSCEDAGFLERIEILS